MGKTQVYSWRISAETKSALESQARREGASIAALLDRITREWLKAQRASSASEGAEQTRLHAVAAATFGTIAGGQQRRAETARGAIRAKLARRYGR